MTSRTPDVIDDIPAVWRLAAEGPSVAFGAFAP
jgi:hypothetical protein